MKSLSKRESGGAALEYVIVSAFAALMSLVAVGFVASIAKEKITSMAGMLKSDAEIDFSPLDEMGLGN